MNLENHKISKTRFDYVLIILFSLVYLVVASVFAGSFSWYYAPLVPDFAITVIFGINYISKFPSIESLGMREDRKQVLEEGLKIVFAVLLLLTMIDCLKTGISNEN